MNSICYQILLGDFKFIFHMNCSYFHLGTSEPDVFNQTFQYEGEEMPMGRNSSSHKDSLFEHRKDIVKQAESPAGILQEIAMKCGNKVVSQL